MKYNLSLSKQISAQQQTQTSNLNLSNAAYSSDPSSYFNNAKQYINKSVTNSLSQQINQKSSNINNFFMSMSKYALKLEQLIKTNNYGDILVTFQYDAEGPKAMTVNSEQLTPDLKHLLDTILGFVNFSLAKNISPYDIAPLLEMEPQDGTHLPMNDVLSVLAMSLRDIPEHYQGIQPASLASLSSRGAQKEVTKQDESSATEEAPMELADINDEEDSEVPTFMQNFMDK